MTLTYVDSQVGDIVTSGDVISLNTKRANLSRWAYLLAGAAEDSITCAPDHSAPLALAYKFSTFKSPASALRKIEAASAKTSWPAIRTPRHLASNLSALALPRSNASRSRKNSDNLVAAFEPRIRTGTSPEEDGNRSSRTRLSALLGRTRCPQVPHRRLGHKSFLSVRLTRLCVKHIPLY